jgi:small subunit ribosomal protein S6
MSKYEMLYIISADVEEEAKKGIIKKFEDLVASCGGTVEKTEDWGEKQLQYPINYKTKGNYVLMTFDCEPSYIAEINRIAGIQDEIIRKMIIKK